MTKLPALTLALSLLMSGCASYGVIQNTPSSASPPPRQELFAAQMGAG